MTLGVVADVQHADKEDGTERIQYFRAAAEKLGRAVDAFAEEKVAGVLNLGDIIDGNVDDATTLRDLERVAAQFDRLKALRVPVYHLLGNHCLCLDRDFVEKRLGMPSSYYAVDLGKNWRLLVCDTNDLCKGTKEGEDFLKLHENEPQMAEWNGGLGSDQLAWLRRELSTPETNFIIATHHPLSDQAARPDHTAWNFREVQEILLEHENVRLALAGHDHPGGYARHSNTHFITLEALLEAPDNSFAFLDIYPDRAVFRGHGSASSYPNLTFSS